MSPDIHSPTPYNPRHTHRVVNNRKLIKLFVYRSIETDRQELIGNSLVEELLICGGRKDSRNSQPSVLKTAFSLLSAFKLHTAKSLRRKL